MIHSAEFHHEKLVFNERFPFRNVEKQNSQDSQGKFNKRKSVTGLRSFQNRNLGTSIGEELSSMSFSDLGDWNRAKSAWRNVFAGEIEKLFSSEFFGETFDSKETEMRRRRLVNANYPFISTWFEILMKRSWLEQENSSSKLSDKILFNEIICVNYRFDERVQDASDLFFQLTEEIPRTGTNFLPKGKHQKSKS